MLYSSETPEAALKGQNLKMVFAIHFVLEMEMLSCADWIAKISEFCFLFENIVFISQTAFFCVCAKQVSASAQTKSQLEQAASYT